MSENPRFTPEQADLFKSGSVILTQIFRTGENPELSEELGKTLSKLEHLGQPVNTSVAQMCKGAIKEIAWGKMGWQQGT